LLENGYYVNPEAYEIMVDQLGLDRKGLANFLSNKTSKKSLSGDQTSEKAVKNSSTDPYTSGTKNLLVSESNLPGLKIDSRVSNMAIADDTISNMKSHAVG
jgi:hypothetical protein